MSGGGGQEEGEKREVGEGEGESHYISESSGGVEDLKSTPGQHCTGR